MSEWLYLDFIPEVARKIQEGCYMILLNYVSFNLSLLLFPLWCFHISSFNSKHDQGTTATSFTWCLFVFKEANELLYASNPLRLSENLPVILLIQTRQCGQSESVVGGTDWVVTTQIETQRHSQSRESLYCSILSAGHKKTLINAEYLPQ